MCYQKISQGRHAAGDDLGWNFGHSQLKSGVEAVVRFPACIQEFCRDLKTASWPWIEATSSWILNTKAVPWSLVPPDGSENAGNHYHLASLLSARAEMLGENRTICPTHW